MFKSLFDVQNNASKRDEGQGLVEYALILVLVSVVVVVVLSQVGPGIGNIFSQIVTVMDGDVQASTGDEDDGDTKFSGTITASDSTDGFRYYDVCSFTVTETGTYSVTGLVTNKSSNFWVTAGPGTLPASGFTIETSKNGGVASTATLNAGTSYNARPHSVTPGDFPVTYEFLITGPGKANGSC